MGLRLPQATFALAVGGSFLVGGLALRTGHPFPGALVRMALALALLGGLGWALNMALFAPAGPQKKGTHIDRVVAEEAEGEGK
ncbi:MAG: hypothetical protein Q8O76_01740 [Chloroflexota bacterium]|nr:hypothetical protein [Chloroflexota bacterium]